LKADPRISPLRTKPASEKRQKKKGRRGHKRRRVDKEWKSRRRTKTGLHEGGSWNVSCGERGAGKCIVKVVV